jgi:hypothetical protein
VERGIVRQVVGDVKTEYSERAMSIDPAMLVVLKNLAAGNAVLCRRRLGLCQSL